jgi:hypothetical protein
MSLSQYLENIELNKNDPDYQIEDFWYGLKNSMKNFYKKTNLKSDRIEKMSNILNEYKKEKKYEMIEEKIKDYISDYAFDIMKYDKFENSFDSNILMCNIRRWKNISNKFHFGNSKKNQIILDLFEAYNNIKIKNNKELIPILELFLDVEVLIINNYSNLIYRSFTLGQIKILETVEKIIGKEKVYNCIQEDFPEFEVIINKNKISYLKLYKKYQKLFL